MVQQAEIINPSLMVESIRLTIQKLDIIKSELSDMIHLAPEHVDYTTQGLRALADTLNKARAYSERTAQLQADAYREQAVAKYETATLSDIHQDIYDKVVERENVRLSHMSWDERASLYRTKCLDTLAPLREAQRLMIVIDARMQIIEVLSRSTYRARGDLSVVADILRAGERLGELGMMEKT